MIAPSPKFLVASAMRNEGAFLLEWVCWYRMLGFDILIATNDCTDHSPELLNALQQAGWLTHISHVPGPNVPPKISAHAALHRHPILSETDWLLICDVDELLVLHHHANISDYVSNLPSPALGVALSWKIFGTSGHNTYQPGLTHRQFRRCGLSGLKINRPFKSLFRNPKLFGRLGAHAPHEYQRDWAAPDAHWVNGTGVRLPQFADAQAHPIRFLEHQQISHEAAQMNHYVLRSREHYAAKKGTLSASSFADRYTDDFFDRRDKNGMKDDSALRFAPRFKPVWQAAQALPEVARLHHICCADYVARLCHHRNADPKADPRWQRHMERAAT